MEHQASPSTCHLYRDVFGGWRWEAGDVTAAWHENLILERFFVPVLDAPTSSQNQPSARR